MSTREHYWVGFFAVTMAEALRSRDPEKILRPALQRFMQEPVADTVRAQLVAVMQQKGVKAHG